MKLSHCKLLRKQQIRLLEYFVLEVAARSDADMLEIQANTSILYYRKLCEIITYHLAQEAHVLFLDILKYPHMYPQSFRIE